VHEGEVERATLEKVLSLFPFSTGFPLLPFLPRSFGLGRLLTVHGAASEDLTPFASIAVSFHSGGLSFPFFIPHALSSFLLGDMLCSHAASPSCPSTHREKRDEEKGAK